MIAGLIGRAFRAIARLRTGESGEALEHVGKELVDLDRRPAHPATISR
jgi:hypothetical protein